MANIGKFKPTSTGFEGVIATLMTNKKARFVANENKKGENSPDYFIKSGSSDLGVAWNDVTEPNDDSEPLEYISVKLEDLAQSEQNKIHIIGVCFRHVGWLCWVVSLTS